MSKGCTARKDGWYCTLEAAHPGPHVAEGGMGQVFAQWVDAETKQPKRTVKVDGNCETAELVLRLQRAAEQFPERRELLNEAAQALAFVRRDGGERPAIEEWSARPWDSSSYDKFQQLCQEVCEAGQQTNSTEYDECVEEIFAPDAAAAADFNSGIVGELLGTGSVTVSVKDRRFVLSLRAVEVDGEGKAI